MRTYRKLMQQNATIARQDKNTLEQAISELKEDIAADRIHDMERQDLFDYGAKLLRELEKKKGIPPGPPIPRPSLTPNLRAPHQQQMQQGAVQQPFPGQQQQYNQPHVPQPIPQALPGEYGQQPQRQQQNQSSGGNPFISFLLLIIILGLAGVLYFLM